MPNIGSINIEIDTFCCGLVFQFHQVWVIISTKTISSKYYVYFLSTEEDLITMPTSGRQSLSLSTFL